MRTYYILCFLASRCLLRREYVELLLGDNFIHFRSGRSSTRIYNRVICQYRNYIRPCISS
ncbi:ORF1166 [White spot syndrome virus]|uniref:ORF1166 n=1 Tax=White spot syndrome virus TaxID=342409 RepID=A0A2D3I759_9VIRU|nr:ORF1166 [White spot syndrome virus]